MEDFHLQEKIEKKPSKYDRWTKKQIEHSRRMGREREARRRIENPEYSRSRSRNSYSKKTKEQKQIVIDRVAKWKKENKDKVKRSDLKNREKIRARTNSEETKIRKRARAKERSLTDPVYNLRRRLRSRFYSAVNVKGIAKNASIMKYTGCTSEELKTHLELLFKPGMAWGKAGSFEVDHIIPISSFNLTKEENLYRCFHFSNLQPLTPIENREKSNKIFTSTVPHQTISI